MNIMQTKYFDFVFIIRLILNLNSKLNIYLIFSNIIKKCLIFFKFTIIVAPLSMYLFFELIHQLPLS